jgi:hypothetical protein
MLSSPYRALLQDRFGELSPVLREFHGDFATWSGKAIFDVWRKPGLVPGILAWFGGLPPPGKAVELNLRIERTETGEWWHRDFAGHKLPSFQWAGPGLLYERFGGICLAQKLEVKEGALELRVVRAWNLGILLPSFAAPSGLGIETQQGESIGVCARAFFPILGELVRYEGLLMPEKIIT